MASNGTNRKGSAIVVGASMAGLLAARVLTDHVQQVTIIERDDLPDSAMVRAGVPQGRHVHALLAQGQTIMESLFPGLSDELTAAGAPRIQWGQDTAYLTPGGWTKRADSGIFTNIIMRPDLEWRVRRRLIAHGKVEIISRTDVTRLVMDGERVVGVELNPRDSSTDHMRELYADLVIDASGRRSRTPEWLKTLGFPAPDESEVNSYIGYSTRMYEKPARDFGWKVLFLNGNPTLGVTRSAGIFEVGDGRWMVTLSGVNKDYPPTDDAGFLDYARGLISPEIYNAIRQATPVTSIYGYRIDGSRWRHYESLTRRPEGLLVMGDALCAFNPVYGQGMTVAAMEARDLGMLLSRRRGDWHGLEAAFQKAAAKSVQRAWLMATSGDVRYADTEGDRPGAGTRMMQQYMDHILGALAVDSIILRAFLDIMNLNAPAFTLFAPHIIWRLLHKKPQGESGWESEFAAASLRAVTT